MWFPTYHVGVDGQGAATSIVHIGGVATTPFDGRVDS